MREVEQYIRQKFDTGRRWRDFHFLIAPWLLIFFSCSSACWADTTIHVFNFDETISYPSPNDIGRYGYPQSITKQDTLIFGNRVVIDTPILTNGGTAIIFAGELVLNAPIDTRVHFDFDPNRLIAQTCPSKPPNLVSPVQALGSTTNAFESYRLFYALTDDVWSTQTNSYSLQEAFHRPEVPILSVTSCVGVATNMLRFPENESLQGILNFDLLKSGDIVVIANSVSFCGTCMPSPSNWDGTKPEIPERPGTPQINDGSMLNAGGIRGSRGSIMVQGCVYGAVDDSACKKWKTRSTWRTEGSSGGAAGSVRIFFSNNPIANSTTPSDLAVLDDLMRHVSVHGGQAGATEQLKADCYADKPTVCVSQPTVGSRAIFPIVSGDPEAGNKKEYSLKGTDGAYSISSIDSDDAVAQVSAEISRLEGAHKQSYTDLLQHAGDPQFIFGTGRSRQKRLHEANARSQRAFAKPCDR